MEKPPRVGEDAQNSTNSWGLVVGALTTYSPKRFRDSKIEDSTC